MTQHIKPANLGGLNSSHALFANIQAFYELGITNKNLVNDAALTTTATSVNDPDIGQALRFDATADAIAQTVSVTGDCTILVVARLTGSRAAGANGNIMFAYTEANGNSVILQYEAFTPYKYRSIHRANFSSTIVTNADGFATDDLYDDGHAVAAVYDLNGTNKTAIDGTLGAATSTAPTVAFAGSPSIAFMSSIGSSASVNVGAIVVFNKALNDTELQSVTSNPWALVSEVNVDPQLDTPQADVTIQEGQTGTIDCGANFSDANAGDTLTFSITPEINSVTGFSFNTSTGVITYDGTQARAGAISYTVTADDGNGGTPASDTFDLTVIEPAFTITGSDTTTPDAGGTVTINFDNEAAAVTASCSAGALSGTYSAGQFILNVPNPPDFGDQSLLFESNVIVTLSDGTNTDTLTIQIQVPAGELYGTITDIDVDGVYANDAGIAVGDLAHFKDITGNPVIDPATGLYSLNPSTNTSFSYSIYDQTDGLWSTAYTTNSYTAETTPPVITLNGANPLEVTQNTTWADPGATVTDNVDATRQISADQTVNTAVLGQVTLTYNATDAAGNAATQVTRTVNVVAAAPAPTQPTENTNNPMPASIYVQVGTDYDLSQHVTNPDSAALNYAIAQGSPALPAGVSLNASTGVLSTTTNTYSLVNGLSIEVTLA